MKSILYFSPDHTDASSFYRGWGPLTKLRGLGWSATMCGTDIDWTTFSNHDLFFMQRPYKPEHVKLLQWAQQQLPVVVDYDDALFAVPPANKAYNVYQDSRHRKSIAACLELADTVTVTTQALADHFSNHATNKTHVVPNAGTIPIRGPRNEKTVLWRGGFSHVNDLLLYKRSIVNVKALFPDWTFIFMGATPWMMQPMELTYVPPLDMLPYLQWLQDNPPEIVIVPLDDCEFNRCKSNLGWIEATEVGALTLGPDWPEWQACSGKYNNGVEFQEELIRLITMSEEGKMEAWEQTEPFMPRVSEVNQERIEIFEGLM